MAYTNLTCKENVFKEKVHIMTSPFGMRTMSGVTSMHNGIDLIGKGYACDYITAFADGKVTGTLNTCAGTSPSTGNYVAIDHGNGISTVYYHLKKGSVAVSAGSTVKKGTVIGYMGTTGNSTGNHLHFGLKINGSWVDPRPYLEGSKTINVSSSAAASTPAATSTSLNIGDVVNFNGGYHYSSSNAATASGGKRTAGKAKITQIAKGAKHPYHVINVSGGGSNVYGWVDGADIGAGTTAAGTGTSSTTFAVGDIVNFKGNTHYANASAASGVACKAGKAKITQIYQLGKSKHPYHLVNVSGGGSNVYGWVDAGTFSK